MSGVLDRVLMAKNEMVAVRGALNPVKCVASTDQQAMFRPKAEALADQQAMFQPKAEALADQQAMFQPKGEALPDQQAVFRRRKVRFHLFALGHPPAPCPAVPTARCSSRLGHSVTPVAGRAIG